MGLGAKMKEKLESILEEIKEFQRDLRKQPFVERVKRREAFSEKVNINLKNLGYKLRYWCVGDRILRFNIEGTKLSKMLHYPNDLEKLRAEALESGLDSIDLDIPTTRTTLWKVYKPGKHPCINRILNIFPSSSEVISSYLLDDLYINSNYIKEAAEYLEKLHQKEIV